MKYSCITDIGLIREKNQDSYLLSTNSFDDLLAIVCDGIGGGLAGEVASSEIVKYFNNSFKDTKKFETVEQMKEYLEHNIALANKHVHDLSKMYREYRGMGTTLTGVLIADEKVVSLNCGDSRVYGFLDHKIFHLTNDHTLINQMLENKEITPEEAINHPKKHYLVKAMGIFDEIEADIHQVKDMEYFLICSDGLHGLVSDAELIDIVYSDKELDDKVVALKDLALLKGGSDNITIILIGR